MKNMLKRHLPLIRKIFGIILVGLGAFVGYWWYYRMRPDMRLSDPRWYVAHSARARWEEEQEAYRRNGVSPDFLWSRGAMIGFCGDKRWCLWLIGKMCSDKRLAFCECTETALMYMTNQEPEGDDDKWELWKEAHQSETQEEWIRDGFAQRGIAVHLPPEPEDTLPLLEVLGRASRPKDADATEEALPGYVRYNAFRWLRDSGFNPIAFSASNTVALTSDVIRSGLIGYMGRNAIFPTYNGIGILAFGKNPTKECYHRYKLGPSDSRFWIFEFLWAFPVAACAAGAALILWRRKK